jgi:hypothetical protein
MLSWPGPKHAVRRYIESTLKSMPEMPYLDPLHLPLADQSEVKYRYVSLSAEPTASVCESGDQQMDRIHCFESRACTHNMGRADVDAAHTTTQRSVWVDTPHRGKAAHGGRDGREGKEGQQQQQQQQQQGTS